MNRFCREFPHHFCKIIITSSNKCQSTDPTKFLHSHHHKILGKVPSSSWNNISISRHYSTVQLYWKNTKSFVSCGNSVHGSHKLHIRGKSFGGYSNFGHKDDEKTPLISKIFLMVPTLGMFSLFVNWPKVTEFIINRGYREFIPNAILDIVQMSDEPEQQEPAILEPRRSLQPPLQSSSTVLDTVIKETSKP